MKFRPHDPGLAQREEAANMALASARFTPQSPEWYAELRLLDLLDTLEHGLMDCYEGFGDEWAADWWPGFPWNPGERVRAVEILQADPRYVEVRDALREWGFDLDEELRKGAE